MRWPRWSAICCGKVSAQIGGPAGCSVAAPLARSAGTFVPSTISSRSALLAARRRCGAFANAPGKLSTKNNDVAVDGLGIEPRHVGRSPFEDAPRVQRALVGHFACGHRRRLVEHQEPQHAVAGAARTAVEGGEQARQRGLPRRRTAGFGAGRLVEPDQRAELRPVGRGDQKVAHPGLQGVDQLRAQGRGAHPGAGRELEFLGEAAGEGDAGHGLGSRRPSARRPRS